MISSLSRPEQYGQPGRESHPEPHRISGANEPTPSSMAEALTIAEDFSNKPRKAIADDIGVRRGYLDEALNLNREDTQFQARLLVPFMRSTGSLAPLRYQAREMGCVVLHVEGPSAFNEHTARILKEASDYFATSADAEADGVITPDEVARAERESEQLIEAVMGHVAWLRSRVGEPR